MNILEIYIRENKLDFIETVNRLQQSGVISDNVVSASEIYDGDCKKAVQWLSENPVN